MTEEFIWKHMGSKIRARRMVLGWTLDYFAKKIGLAVSTVSQLETGKIAITLKNVVKIQSVLRTDLLSFLIVNPKRESMVAALKIENAQLKGKLKKIQELLR